MLESRRSSILNKALVKFGTVSELSDIETTKTF